MSNHAMLAAWRELWNQRLLRFLRRRAQAVDIEDLAQETYLRLLRLPDLRTVRNPKAYLLRVASHIASEWRHARPALELLSAIEENTLIEHVTPESELQAAVLHQRVSAVLADVTPMMRAVLLLRLRDGLSYKEIAEDLDLTDRQVRRYLERGYTRLRDVLES